MISEKKLKRILSDHINGNLGNFRRSVGRLNRRELLCLIAFYFDNNSQNENLLFINKLYTALVYK